MPSSSLIVTSLLRRPSVASATPAVTVQGTIADVVLPHLLAGATHVIVAMPGVAAERRERAIELARQTGLAVMSVPPRMEVHDAPEAVPT